MKNIHPMLHFLSSPEQPFLPLLIYYFRIYLTSIINMLVMLFLDLLVLDFIYLSASRKDEDLAFSSLHAPFPIPSIWMVL